MKTFTYFTQLVRGVMKASHLPVHDENSVRIS